MESYLEDFSEKIARGSHFDPETTKTVTKMPSSKASAADDLEDGMPVRWGSSGDRITTMKPAIRFGRGPTTKSSGYLRLPWITKTTSPWEPILQVVPSSQPLRRERSIWGSQQHPTEEYLGSRVSWVRFNTQKHMCLFEGLGNFQFFLKTWFPKSFPYCWWKKSCTTWDV